jgi:Mg-chelatase subunit ChlD
MEVLFHFFLALLGCRSVSDCFVQHRRQRLLGITFFYCDMFTRKQQKTTTAFMSTNEAFICPITQSVMVDPVTDTDGNTFERAAIVEWLKAHGTSPITRNAMRAEDLVPNRALAAALCSGPQPATVQQAATAPPEQDAAVNGPLDVTCVVSAETSTLLISIVPPAGPVAAPQDRIPVDVVCVVDISGSMATTATVKDEKGNTETDGLTLLDVVKHATRTVAGLLGPNDRLAVVTFSDNAAVAMKFTPMNTQGKKQLDTTFDAIDTLNSTNLWDGLITAMDLLKGRTGADRARNAAIMLLTDGQPNVEPPRGHIPTLERYLDEFQGPVPFTVSTFGFGYSLDSKLLRDIAVKTGGMYIFIPDSGLVGTVFVNTVANVLCTAATAVSVTVDCGRPILDADPSFSVTRSGANASLGTVQFGQQRNITFRMGAAEGKLAAEPPVVRLTYMYRGQEHSKLVTARVAEGVAEQQQIVAHAARCVFAKSVTDLCSAGSSCTASQIAKIRATIVSLSPAAETLPLVAALLKDLEGEVKMALTDISSFKKWGAHFLPSIVCATQMQQCNNFKDHSVQLYGGELFKKLQGDGEKVFTKIAPPKPKVRPVSSATRRGTAGAACAAAPAAAPVNMARYYNRGGGCVLASCRVALAGGHHVPAAGVKPGDTLASGATVRCVVRIAIPRCTPMVTLPGGLTITQFHPVKIGGEWVFPVNAADATPAVTSEPFVYTYVLHGGSSVIVDGIEVVALGHGLQDNEVVMHDYLGTDRVVRDLMALDGFEEGRVTVGGFRRNSVSMRIEGVTALAAASVELSNAAAPVSC